MLKLTKEEILAACNAKLDPEVGVWKKEGCFCPAAEIAKLRGYEGNFEFCISGIATESLDDLLDTLEVSEDEYQSKFPTVESVKNALKKYL